jgi:hypothetical protein
MAGVGYRLQGASNEKENTMNKVKRKEREVKIIPASWLPTAG